MGGAELGLLDGNRAYYEHLPAPGVSPRLLKTERKDLLANPAPSRREALSVFAFHSDSQLVSHCGNPAIRPELLRPVEAGLLSDLGCVDA